MIKLKIGLCFICLILFLVSNSFAAATINDFSEQLVGALEKKNVAEYEALVFPASLTNSMEKGMEKHNKKVALLLKQKAPSEFASYNVVVEDINKNSDYSSVDNSIYLFGGKRAYFPVKLEKKLTIYVKEGSVAKSGEWTTPLTSQVLVNSNGRWYMVWPKEIR